MVPSRQRADRLNPIGTSANANLGYVIAHFGARAHDHVVEWTGRILRERSAIAPALPYRAASLALLGRMEEARSVVSRLLELTHNYTITELRRHQEST